MVARLSFLNAPAEFRAIALSLRQVEAPIRRAVGQDMRATMAPVWRSRLTEGAARGDGRVGMLTVGARIAAGNPPALVTASSTRPYGQTRLRPTEHWAGFEYGARGRRVTYDRRRAGGKPHKVTRDVLTGHPARRRTGRVIGPAVTDVLPRVGAYWVQSVVRIVMDAAEGKRRG